MASGSLIVICLGKKAITKATLQNILGTFLKITKTNAAVTFLSPGDFLLKIRYVNYNMSNLRKFMSMALL